MTFRLSGIAHEPFLDLFDLGDAELAARGAVRVIAEADFGYPCRVSLKDADAGEELLLLPYEHLPRNSPYRASGPIFVRKHAVKRLLDVDEVPSYVTRRLISVRAYDSDDMMLSAEVCEGPDVAAALVRHFSDPHTAYIHLHNAARGCFSCRADRA
jgi:hypothetical protein